MLLWLREDRKVVPQVNSRWREECLKEEYRQQPVTFDEWRSAREEKGGLITDKPFGETNTDLNPLLLTTTPTNMCVLPTGRPNKGFRHTLSDNAGCANLRLYSFLFFIAPRSPRRITDWCQPPIGLCLGASSWLETFKLELYCNLLSLRAKCDSIAILKLALTDNTWKGVTSLSIWHHLSLSSLCVASSFHPSLPWPGGSPGKLCCYVALV